MINVETVKFMKTLDKLAELATNGIEDFADATQKNYHDKVFYDRDTMEEEREGPFGRYLYRVMYDACVLDDPECPHHDITCYYDSYTDEYTVRAVFYDNEPPFGNEPPFIEVRFAVSDSVIVIENGKWYFA